MCRSFISVILQLQLHFTSMCLFIKHIFPSPQLVVDGKSSWEYSVNAGVPQGSILSPSLFLLFINDLPDDTVCNIAMYDDDTTLCSKCEQTSG